ncbi:dihydrofolate synthase / folylpolyglutamate synthase [Desulfonispora thiosulfatigenes DSM 11270]|uniref:Dihydrofolate synthase/folylpolyglutamate synthase n=1 Tax=Desulfonispora thiosulfatigenes DSM 11270 TaxID=656914 RepID=A0A1W1VFY9_DESTI|nr:folylpolyglutamate synthase/dihydrofolate synthase family protein [Desulfonispora thiosulfatigenes]SMB92123.1 dihydrofolate synthase / folylpolyglutamate synthase [Desulfonispora thiosulfatigenes DSM 11270]
MKYDEALEFLQGSGKFGINLGLNRVSELLENLDNPHEKIKIIHIAGTNGKGSVTAMLNSILSQAGLKVGVYTSPHLHSYTERIKINNSFISEEDFALEMVELKGILPKIIKKTNDNPTEFEILTAVALNYFYKQKVDIAIVEVGMGGRLDSTNVVNPIMSIITPIGKDHENFLGDTYEKISLEKAGIFKKDTPVVIGKQREECKNVLISEAKKKDCPVYFVDKVKVKELLYTELGQKLEVISENFTNEIFLSLLGDHQRENMKIVLTAIKLLSDQGLLISKDNIKIGLKNVKWPGRLELIIGKRKFVFDGAHNPQGAQALRDSLPKYFKYDNLIIILGILEDKDQERILEQIIPLAKTFIVTKPANFRTDNWQNVAQIIKRKSSAQVIIEEQVESAINKANELTNKGDLICITGSLYLIGEAREYVLKNLFPA